jgi:hypothetical protein
VQILFVRHAYVRHCTWQSWSFSISFSCWYPHVQEQCSALLCPKSYKFQDCKSKVPLCSLTCYKVVHAITSM